MGYIVGQDRNQQTFWSLEEMIEEESMVRVIDRFVETVNLKELGFTRTQAKGTGRPGYAAEPMAKLYIYSYDNGIRSSRKLEKETKRNLEVIWLMEGMKPDHSSISEFRRQNVKALKRLFREFVKICRSWELTGGEVVAQDGTKMGASNGSQNNYKIEKINARLNRIDERIAEFLASMKKTDEEEQKSTAYGETKDNPTPKELMDLMKRKEKYESIKEQIQTTAVSEVSTTDPDSRQMGRRGEGYDISYNTQIAVDSKHHIILDCDVTNNPTDRGEMSKMAKRLKKRRLILPKNQTAYLADKGYYSGKDLAKMKRMGIKAIVPRQDPPRPKGQPERFYSTNFEYSEETDTYTCPMGYTLSLPKSRKAKTVRREYSNKTACKKCPHRNECISGKSTYRSLVRREYAEIYDAADKTYAQNIGLYKLRQQLAEHPFGTLKRNMNGSFFLLRTLPKVRGEAALFFLAYNIKRAFNVLGFKEIMARLDGIAACLSHFFTFYIIYALHPGFRFRKSLASLSSTLFLNSL